MKCPLCKSGETHPGTTTVLLERAGAVFVVKDVPAEVCENCSEAYPDASVSGRVLELAEAAAARGAEVEVLRFAA